MKQVHDSLPSIRHGEAPPAICSIMFASRACTLPFLQLPDAVSAVRPRQVPAEAFRGPVREVLTFASQLAAAGDDRLEVTWPALRAVGAGFWLTEPEAVR